MDWTILSSLSLCFLLLYLSGVYGQENPTSIKTMNGKSRFKPGETVDILCSVEAAYGRVPITWRRKVGGLEMDISDSPFSMISTFNTKNRYVISDYDYVDAKRSYKLTITNLQYEDIAQIGCLINGKNSAYTTISVCEDFTSTACECINKMGWTAPSCFEKPVSVTKMKDKYDKTVTGLAVCLAVAVIFGLLLAVMVGWDCMAKTAAKKKKQMEMQKSRMAAKRAGYTGYEESENVVLDPNDPNLSFDGLKSPVSTAPINNYASMSSEKSPGTHVNKAYMMDEPEASYTNRSGANRYPSSAAQGPDPGYGGARGGIPEATTAAQIEVHTVDDDMRDRMEYGRATPEGSVGSKGNNEPPSSNVSKYDLRSPRNHRDYNPYPPSSGPTTPNHKYGFEHTNNATPSLRYQDTNSNSKSPGSWSTQSAGLPPMSRGGGRGGADSYPYDDYNHGYSDQKAQGRTINLGSGAYMDQTDTVV